MPRNFFYHSFTNFTCCFSFSWSGGFSPGEEETNPTPRDLYRQRSLVVSPLPGGRLLARPFRPSPLPALPFLEVRRVYRRSPLVTTSLSPSRVVVVAVIVVLARGGGGGCPATTLLVSIRNVAVSGTGSRQRTHDRRGCRGGCRARTSAPSPLPTRTCCRGRCGGGGTGASHR